MDGMAEAVLFLAMVVVVAVAGVRLGMLVAPRLGRLAERHDEDDVGNDD